MGPGVDPELLEAKADIAEDAFRVLDDIEAEGEEAFLQADRNYYAARAALLEAIEAALDAANHVIAAEGYRRAEGYADLVSVLEEEGLLEEALAERVRGIPLPEPACPPVRSARTQARLADRGQGQKRHRRLLRPALRGAGRLSLTPRGPPPRTGGLSRPGRSPNL